MALFNRNKKDAVLPEVEKYYEAEKRDRAGAGWLLALVSVMTVALVIVGLFLAGRWAYNKVTDDGEVATTENADNETPNFDGQELPSGNTDTDDKDGDSANTDESNGATSDDDQATSDDNADGDVNAPARTDTPNTAEGGKSGDLPNTGPADTLAVFAVSTIAGTAVQYAAQRRKIQR
ncbi:MAG: hypothetical protein M3Q14_02530 [bacterium]|nr:hypothetical protein [bacterium]